MYVCVCCSCTMRRSWTCLMGLGSRTVAAGSPASRSTRTPVAASTPPESPPDSSAPRTRCVCVSHLQDEVCVCATPVLTCICVFMVCVCVCTYVCAPDAAVSEARCSVQDHGQHPDERPELALPCHLHHPPLSDEGLPDSTG